MRIEINKEGKPELVCMECHVATAMKGKLICSLCSLRSSKKAMAILNGAFAKMMKKK